MNEDSANVLRRQIKRIELGGVASTCKEEREEQFKKDQGSRSKAAAYTNKQTNQQTKQEKPTNKTKWPPSSLRMQRNKCRFPLATFRANFSRDSCSRVRSSGKQTAPRSLFSDPTLSTDQFSRARCLLRSQSVSEQSQCDL